MVKRANKVVNGTAADEPSAHNTRFNRKKMPNINLKSQNTNYKRGRRLLWDCSNELFMNVAVVTLLKIGKP